MNKSYKGVREYLGFDGYNVFDVVLIIWNNKHNSYEISTFDGALNINVSNLNPDIIGQWTVDLGSAKRKALKDTGLKSSDFKWEEIYS